jgi:hypothetical protein
MKFQLVLLEDSKLMKFYCLDGDIMKKDSFPKLTISFHKVTKLTMFQLCKNKNLEELK